MAPVDTRHVCHIAFLVDDVAASRAELEGRGLTFEGDTAVAQRLDDHRLLRDPEGNRLQIVHRPRPLVPLRAGLGSRIRNPGLKARNES